MSYKYWDDFVAAWSRGAKNYYGWTDPDGTPLYNNSATKDLSSLFIPEPWWGNDGSRPLHSVVINYNPGMGNSYQKAGCVGKVSSYAKDIVYSSKFEKTQQWHSKNRALPILKSLNRISSIKTPFCLENHLSIELIPWHTLKADKSYWDYVKANPKAIYDNVISFAANEASRIENSKLKNVALLRMSGTNTLKLLSILGQDPKQAVTRCGNTGSSKTEFVEFRLPKLSGTRFISFWGRSIRNGMPSASEIDNLLRLI